MEVFSPNSSQRIQQNSNYTFVFSQKELNYSFMNFWRLCKINHLFRKKSRKWQKKIFFNRKTHFNSQQTSTNFKVSADHLFIQTSYHGFQDCRVRALNHTSALPLSLSFCHTGHFMVSWLWEVFLYVGPLHSMLLLP